MPDGSKRIRGLVVLASLAGAIIVACSSPAAPGATAESWQADLVSRQELVRMTLTTTDGRVTGTGLVAALTNPGGESYAVSGARRADTLDIQFGNFGVPSFRFLGVYRTKATIVGTLDGSTYAQLGATFVKR